MIYITFNLNPSPGISVKLSFLLPEKDFKIFVVACTILGL